MRRGGVGAGLDIPRSLVSNETAVRQPKLKFFCFFCFSSGWALTTKICNENAVTYLLCTLYIHTALNFIPKCKSLLMFKVYSVHWNSLQNKYIC